MKAFPFLFSSALILSVLSCGEVFADETKDLPATDTVKEAPKDSGKPAASDKGGKGEKSDKTEKEKIEKEKIEKIENSGSELTGSDSGTGDVDPTEKEREKQKAIDDVNAFLIESYKIKLDKLLDDVYRSVRVAAKDDPALQTLLLKRVLSEIEVKMQSISDRNISSNRKKILLSVFSYLKNDVESKIRSFGEK